MRNHPLSEFDFSKQSIKKQYFTSMYIMACVADEHEGKTMTQRQTRLRRVATVLLAQTFSEEFERVANLVMSGALLTEVDKTAANKTFMSGMMTMGGVVNNLGQAEGHPEMVKKLVNSFMLVHNSLRNLADSGARYTLGKRHINLFSNADFRRNVDGLIFASRGFLENEDVDEETKKRIKSNNIEIQKTLDATKRGTDMNTRWEDISRISRDESQG
jgi:hypothetical protein